MKNPTHLWRRPHIRGGKAIPITIAALFALVSIPAKAVDPIVGYDPATDAPSNAYSFDFEGCNLDKNTETTYDPGAGIFFCDSDFATPEWPDTQDSYTDGNLGKEWEELDEVPHRIGSDSSGAAGPETYRIVIGGDNLINPATTPPTVGYDRITVFDLVPEFSDASCSISLIGGNQFGDFGIGGADTQVVQVIEITQDANTQCVIDATYRLAIGSSLVSGSSNRGFVVAGTGAQSIPIPSDIQPQSLSKSMSAVEDSLINWTIQKDADPVNFNFGNTCNIDVPNSKNVVVDITFTKGATQFGDLTATTTINAANPSSRTVRYNCTDTVYGDVPGDDMGEIQVDQDPLTFDLEPGMEMPTIEHILAPGTRDIRNELSCDLQVEDLVNPGLYIDVGTLEAEFSLPNDDIAAGEVVNASVVVDDTESITLGASRYDFSAVQSGGVGGSFSGYIPGTTTDGPVLWSSNPQSGSGTVQFTKTVTVERGYDINGKLEDTASIDLTDTTDVQASAATTFSTDPKIDLVIKKNLGFTVTEDTVWQFSVKNSSNVEVATPQITVTGGTSAGQVTVNDLDPDTYTVSETVVAGWVPAANPQNVVLSLPNCEGEVTFTNNPATNFFADVEVKKMTDPAGQEAGWTFDLAGPENAQVVTTDGNFIQFNLDGGNNVGADVGAYTITEQLLPGWDPKSPTAATLNVVGCLDPAQNSGPTTSATSCSFSVAYLQHAGCTFQCTIENVQRGKIIVEKITDPSDSTQIFDFSGDAAGTIGHGGTIMEEVVPGTYSSMETVPDGWDLTDISCDDADDASGASGGNLETATATFDVQPGETVTCTFTNVERGMADVTKTVLGSPPTGDQSFDFEIRVGASISDSGTAVASATADATSNTNVPFTCVSADPAVCIEVGGMAKLPPGDYQFCEANVMPGWTSSIKDWTNAFPLPSINGAFFVPNALDPLVDNSIYCAPFTLAAGETESFSVDNSPPPGGDARTIGFWKNWTGCDGNGNQDPVLDETLALAMAGVGIHIGGLLVDTCQEAVLILDKRDTNGKKQASDACFNAASQLLASELNEVAGAKTCQDLVDLQSETQQDLVDAKFEGNACKLPKKSALASSLNTAAGQLDAYNNNDPGAVCN